MLDSSFSNPINSSQSINNPVCSTFNICSVPNFLRLPPLLSTPGKLPGTTVLASQLVSPLLPLPLTLSIQHNSDTFKTSQCVTPVLKTQWLSNSLTLKLNLYHDLQDSRLVLLQLKCASELPRDLLKKWIF